MKIGICGVRGLGRDFLNLCGLHPDVESVAIADLDAVVRAKAREKTGVSQDYETLEELLDADVDAVGIFTPPWTHAELAIQALQAGKHVLSACPAGLTLDELAALVDTVQVTGKIYMIAETSYYYRGAIYAR